MLWKNMAVARVRQRKLLPLILLLLLVPLPAVVWACDCSHADFVPSLPGFNQPTPSPVFSGYLSYELQGRNVHTHYILVQAEQDFRREKPLIYWSNGGPGASSLFGLFTELGPLQLSDLSTQTADYRATGIPTLVYSPYAWTRLGSVLVFDQPAPVGFSYCNDDTAAQDCAKLAWTDELAAQNSHLALQAFYAKFPCYNTTDLYLTGESYAGIYIPTLTRRILLDKSGPIRELLKGFAVGDGCLGTETGVCSELSEHHRPDLWRVLFLAGHGQIPFATFAQVLHACQAGGRDEDGEETENVHTKWLVDDDKCQKALAKVSRQVGGYFEYSLYDDCIYRNLGRTRVSGALNDYPCGGYPVMTHWLAHPAVKRALHVKGDFFSVDNAENFDYTPTEKDLTGFYRQVVTQTPVRVLVYNGDSDPSITSLEAQNWTSSLGLPEIQSWRPWSIDSCQRVGGYVTRYSGNFDFLTIRGAGHMVPTYKAEATFTFMKAWIEGKDYPVYDKSCTKPVSASTSALIAVPPEGTLTFAESM